MKIAIIGSGIAGLGSAYLLSQEHNVTVFEKNDYPGGHARTREIVVADKTIQVDTGFIVFNDRNYPNLIALFDRLNVPYEKSDMSFGVSIEQAGLEYSSNHMFADRKNLFRAPFWKMLYDILRFNRKALQYVKDYPDKTLGECMNELHLSRWFQEHYLLAMGAAIWSCPLNKMLDFPARTFVQFFHNHGLLTINDHPQWYTVSGGSQEYIKRIIAPFKDNLLLNTAVKCVCHTNDGIEIKTDKTTYTGFDQVVFACHADEALEMIDTPDQKLMDTLKHFGYQPNRVVVHSDTRFMPGNKACWSSWVYLCSENNVSLSYWMNNLQNLESDLPIIITLNPVQEPEPDLVYEQHQFSHPVFDQGAIEAQQGISAIQGMDNYWFCGAYQRYGFHEDGLLSAVNVAQGLGVKIPWV